MTNATRTELQFDDNRLLPLLYGEHDAHLSRIEHQLGVTLVNRGNIITVAGAETAVEKARATLETLWQRLRKGLRVTIHEVDAALRMAADGEAALASLHKTEGGGQVVARKTSVTPRTPTQKAYLEAMERCELVFGVGPAGTGKTFLAVAEAVAMMSAGQVARIILSRPAVEAGERLGFLPGDMREKVDPYLRPIYDALNELMGKERVARKLETGEIEIAPLAFMRGRTLSNAFIILDEAQNTTPLQMKMFLTRLGENSRMVITGDVTQVDLPNGQESGLRDALRILQGVEGIEMIEFNAGDVVRHPLVGRIVTAYDQASSHAVPPKRRYYED